MLHELEERNAFVSALDPARTWFRYHALFADLLRLELRRSEPSEVAGLHRLAAGWLARNGDVQAAVRHAQAAEDWPLVSELLGERSFRIALDGHGASIDAILETVPPDVVPRLPGCARVCAATRRGSAPSSRRSGTWRSPRPTGTACRRNAGPAAGDARHTRMTVARRRGRIADVLDEARRALDPANGDLATAGGDDMRAMVLVLAATSRCCPAAPAWERYLDEALELSRRAGRPVAAGPVPGAPRPRAGPAVAGPLAGAGPGVHRPRGPYTAGAGTGPSVPAAALALVGVWQADIDHAEEWLSRSERILGADVEPALSLMLAVVRGTVLVARGGPRRRGRRPVPGGRGAAAAPRRPALPGRCGDPAAGAEPRGPGRRPGRRGGDRQAPAADGATPAPMLLGRAAVALATGDTASVVGLTAMALDPAEGNSPPFRIQAHLLAARAHDAAGDAAAARDTSRSRPRRRRAGGAAVAVLGHAGAPAHRRPPRGARRPTGRCCRRSPACSAARPARWRRRWHRPWRHR
ncbi:MAG: hypothetical protein U0237_15885 [Thermoleophilia bacterium]